MKIRRLLSGMLAFFGLGCACGQQNYENLDVQKFAELIKSSDVTILDVRTVKEFSEGHINGALNIDVDGDGFLEEANMVLDKTKTIAVYCRSGRRSADAASKLADAGFKVVNLSGGILAWQKAELEVTKREVECDVFITKPGRAIQIYALMHASMRITFGEKEIYVDPVCRLGDRTVDYSSMPKADYILVTHEHKDHLDAEAIKQLTKDGTKLITNARCAEMLGSGDVMANGDAIILEEGMTLEAVPAYNITEGRQQFHPKGRDNGFILALNEMRIYIAGDTEDIPEMSEIKDIEIAFLPCNQPYTMTPEQLIKAAQTIKPKVLFPYHYGQTDVTAIPDQLKPQGIDVRIRHYE